MVLGRLKSFIKGLAQAPDDEGAWWPVPETQQIASSAVEQASRERKSRGEGLDVRYRIELKTPGRASRVGCAGVLLIPAVVVGFLTFGNMAQGWVNIPPYVGGSIAAVLGLGGAYALLGLLAPRLKVLADRETFDPAALHTLAWSFSGTPRGVRRLRVRLAGQERATYSQGTTTTTDTHAFHKVVLYDTQESGESVTTVGTFDLDFPPDAMHSFKSDNNEIRWTLEVKAWVSFLPDIRHNLVLTVWADEDPRSYYGWDDTEGAV